MRMVIILGVCLVSLFFYGCNYTPLDSPQLPQRGYFMGILPIPAESQSFEEAYTQASLYAEFSPVWGRPTPYYNFADDLKGEWGQIFVKEYIRDKGMFPIINVSFFGENISLIVPTELEGCTLSDNKWRSTYKNAVINIVKVSRPLFLCIGNEVNRWYEKYGIYTGGPNSFEHYISLYEEIYDAIKSLSPEVKVFCTFAREIISGNREADLKILSEFNMEKLDLIVFTSYPYAIREINQVSDIPDDYYSKIFVENGIDTNKLFGFTEVGWPSMDIFGGEESQSKFVEEIPTRLTVDQGLNLYLYGWPWLHDLDNNDTIGLIKADGSEKMAYQTWKKLSRTTKQIMITGI